MSLDKGFTWTHRNLKLTGYSIGGVTTSIAMPDADCCFDVGQGLPFQLSYENILITHGHMDHASGIPYLISQKGLTGQIPAKFYMPEVLVQPMREIMRIWEAIDQHSYQFTFKAAVPDQDYPLKSPYFFRTFPTIHRVKSQGYTVFEKKKRLLPEFRHLAPQEFAELRRKGTVFEEHFSEPIVSFTGDTQIEFLESEQVQNSRVCVMEVTYWDDRKSVANAREWGHIHLDELLPRLHLFKGEKLLLIHASSRYSSTDLQRIIEARIPEQFKSRIALFPRPI